MSRYEIPTTQAGLTCIVGWDPPLGTFYAQIYREVGQRRQWRLWVGTEVAELPTIEAQPGLPARPLRWRRLCRCQSFKRERACIDQA